MKYTISELLNLGFLFSFTYFRFPSYVTFINVTPTPYRPSKTFFWIKMGSENRDIHLRDFKDAFIKYGF